MSRITQDPLSLGARKVELDEPFSFGCQACGNCCRGRTNSISGTDIFLSGPDVQRIAHALHNSVAEMIDKYIVTYDDPDLGLTVCRLRIRLDGSCRLLTSGKCIVYDSRPRTCALYPLGRAIIFEKRKNSFVYAHDEYVLNEEKDVGYQCERSTPHTVQEWLILNNVPLEDLEDRRWHLCLLELAQEARTTHLPLREFQRKAFDRLYTDWSL